MPVTARLTWKDVLFCSGDYRAKFFKIADYFLGGLLCFIIRPADIRPIGLDKDKIRRILIIRPGGIGDAALLIPFIKEAKDIFKNAQIDILAEKRNRGVFLMLKGLIERVYYYDNFNIFFLPVKLKKNDYDIIFDTEQWHNLTALFAYFIRAKIRVGFDTRKQRSKFYTHLAPYSQEDYERDSFLNLLRRLHPGLVIKYTAVPFISLPGNLISWARGFIAADKEVVALCLSAGIPERGWPSRNFQELTNELIAKDYKVLFLGGKKERKLSGMILKGVSKKENILDFVGKTSLSETAALLSLCRLYIGLDSGILHLAYALGLPTISLFGPGIKDKWVPRGAKHIAISANLSCSPCTLFGYTRHCRNPKCMSEIKAEDIGIGDVP